MGVPHSAGRGPVRALPPSSRAVRVARLPQEAGRVPFRKGRPYRFKLDRVGKAHEAGREPAV